MQSQFTAFHFNSSVPSLGIVVSIYGLYWLQSNLLFVCE